MAITLEGGCRVSEMREGESFELGNLRLWPQVDQQHGAKAISLRVLEFGPGLSQGLRNKECDEILYLLGDANDDPPTTIFIDGWPYEVPPDSGIYLRPNQTLTIDNR